MLAPWKKSYDSPRQHIKKQRHYFADKGLYKAFDKCQSYGFSINHVWMWELDQKNGWMLKNWCFWIVMLENSWVSWTAWSHQSILKEINPEYSLEGLMLKLKPQHFGQLMWRGDSEKDPDAGKDWGQEEKGRQDGITNWNEHEFEQTAGDRGQGSLVCCSPWCCKESDTTEQMIMLAVSLQVNLYKNFWREVLLLTFDRWKNRPSN